MSVRSATLSLLPFVSYSSIRAVRCCAGFICCDDTRKQWRHEPQTQRVSDTISASIYRLFAEPADVSAGPALSWVMAHHQRAHDDSGQTSTGVTPCDAFCDVSRTAPHNAACTRDSGCMLYAHNDRHALAARLEPTNTTILRTPPHKPQHISSNPSKSQWRRNNVTHSASVHSQHSVKAPHRPPLATPHRPPPACWLLSSACSKGLS